MILYALPVTASFVTCPLEMTIKRIFYLEFLLIAPWIIRQSGFFFFHIYANEYHCHIEAPIDYDLLIRRCFWSPKANGLT